MVTGFRQQKTVVTPNPFKMATQAVNPSADLSSANPFRKASLSDVTPSSVLGKAAKPLTQQQADSSQFDIKELSRIGESL